MLHTEREACPLSGLNGVLVEKVLLVDLKSVLARIELLGDPLFPGGVVQGVPGFVTEFLCRLWLFHLWVVVRKGWRVGFGARRLVHSRISF
jgi:hypothetical protein